MLLLEEKVKDLGKAKPQRPTVAAASKISDHDSHWEMYFTNL